jgi:hypothetical protein
MAVVALMWEARARPGLGPDLLTWARAQHLAPAPARRETFSAPPDRVLVITWWPADTSATESTESADSIDLPELPDPPAGLLHRPVHRWRFTQEPESEPEQS